MSFPAYASYKDSGVDWLGQVPSTWEVKRLAHYFDERRTKVSDVDYPALSVTKNGIVPQLETAAKTDDGDNRKLVLAGDFVINSRSDRKGSSGLSGLDGSVSLINTVLEPQPSMAGPFAHHLLRSVAFQEEYYRYGKGIVADLWSTNFSEARNIVLAVPPIGEQRAIATFLDRETAKIDALVEAQRRLIELLKEKRQAVISHAVTKGLDPSTPMKDSGVEWLGQVPAHWEVMVVGRVIDLIEQGWSPAAHDREPDVGEASVLRLSAVKDGQFVSHQRKALPDLSEEELAAAPRVQAGDFLLTRANTPDLVGDCAIASEVLDTIFSDLIYRVSFSAEMDPRFMLLVLRSSFARWQIRRDARGSSMSMAKLSHGHIKAWWMAVPPRDEQERIVATVATRVSELDRLAAGAESAVLLLQERRAALISAAVTGKIDVRGSAAPVQEAHAA